MKSRFTIGVAVLYSGFLFLQSAFAQGTAFTYQSRLNDGGGAANGSYDLRFALFDDAATGAQQGNAVTNSATAISNGLFTVTLDFGNQFPGADRWLEIGVRTNGGGAFATLSPRQQLTATPYAVVAGNVTGAVAAGQLSGTVPLAQLPASVITNGASGVSFSGTFAGNGAGLTDVDLLTVNRRGAISFTARFAGAFTATSAVGDESDCVIATNVVPGGLADLISVNANSNTVEVLHNNGSGGFGAPVSYAVGNSPRCVTAARLNNDTAVDLVTANYGDNTLTVLLNDGGGSFSSGPPLFVGNGPRSVVAADVNGDGKRDLISANSGNNTLTIWLGNGFGGFSPGSVPPPVGSDPRSVTAADVNGDGKMDLITANYGNNTLTILTNNGFGGFVVASSPSVGLNPQSVVAADVNGDTKVDLICANTTADTLTILTNNGSGSFAIASSPAVGSGPYSVVAADVNGDGKPDLISANFDSKSLTVLTNNGSGGFAVASSPDTFGKPRSVAAGDVNGDGGVDLVAGNFAYALAVLINTPVQSASFTGDGSGLANLNAGNLGGTIPLAKLPAGLLTNGASAVSLSGAFTGNGAGLTNLNAGNLSSGTLNDARLSPNVPRLNASNQFTGPLVATNPQNLLAGTFAGDGSSLSNLNVAASQITGTLQLAQLPPGVVTDGSSGLTLGGTFSGNGAGLANLNAGNISSGTLDNARLAANVALLDGTQVFSGSNQFAGPLVATNADSQFAGLGSGLIGINPANLAGGTAPINISGTAATATTANTATTAGTAISFSGALSGDVTGSQTATVVSSLGGQSAANVATGASAANAATSANVADTIVKRDASGNFSAGALNAASISSGPVSATSVSAGSVSATSVDGSGGGLTNLNAGNVSSGTLADARLSSNVPLLGGTNIFAGTNRFAGVVLATNSNNLLVGAFAGNGNGLTNLSVGASQITGTMALSQLPPSLVTNGAAGVTLTGGFNGNGGGLTNLSLADGSVTAPKIASGQVVKSLNGLRDNVSLVAGPGIALTTNGNTLQISNSIPSQFSTLAVQQSTNYTSAGTYSFSIPAGMTNLTVKLWGAGGGAGLNSQGGGGGFAMVSLPVTLGEQYTLVVGQRGAFSAANLGGSGSNDGAGGDPGFLGDYNNRGEGGQASSLFKLSGGQYIMKAVAGGGGGGGLASGTPFAPGGAGGGGNGSVNGDASAGSGGGNGLGGAAGGGASPGSNYSANAVTSGESALNLMGGKGGNAQNWSGGGGGGYGGGGGGGGGTSGSGAGGGGGGSYGDSTIAGGNGNGQPGNTADADYISPRGVGGLPGAGNDGLAVVKLTGPVVTNGAVPVNLSGTFSGNGTMNGAFSGTFSGNGSGLTNLSLTGDGSGVTNLNASALTGTVPLGRLPAAVVTNGASSLTLTGTFTGNGGALTNLNAANLGSGTLSDARLSANVALLNAGNVFTGINRFAGAMLATNGNNQLVGTFTGNGASISNVDLRTINGEGVLSLTTNYGNFGNGTTLGVGGAPRAIARADVNGDGRTDLITANELDNTLTVLTNNGSGGFLLSSSPAGNAGGSRFVTAADMNGDGKPDLITANVNGSASVLTNNGSGGFPFANVIGAASPADAVAAADVNADGRNDVITVDRQENLVKVLTNDGSGGFTLATTLAVGSGPVSIAAADLNGDGKVDLITANETGNNLTILTNNGTGGFAIASSPGVGTFPEFVIAQDVNADGKLDLITANSGANTLTVLTNNGSGGFAIASSPGVGTSPYGVAVIDVNGDGKPDLISANFTANTLSVLTNAGNGQFTLSVSPAVGDHPRSVVPVFADGDARPDLACANYYADTVTVLYNIDASYNGYFTGNSSGTFTGNGSGLTSLNAANLTSGTVPIAQLPTAVVTNGASGLSLAGTFTGNGAGLTGVALLAGGNTFSGNQTITSGTVTATGFSGNGGGLTNLVTPTIANYVHSYSTTTQTVALVSTYQDITNHVDAQISGWAHTPATASFTNNQSGLYLVQYTAIAMTSAAGATTISLRAVANGTEIADSQSTAVVDTANQTTAISKSFITSFSAGDVLKFQLAGTSVNNRIVANTGLGTTRPSFSFTLIRLQ